MKKPGIVFVFLLSAFLSIKAQEEQIVWEKDFKKAQALALETSRPLLLDFTAEWCKPCKAMDANFWVLPDVIRATKPFIAVKIDFDKERSLVEKYRVGAIPFVIFTDPLGNLVTYRRGFGRSSINELNSIFNEMPKDFSPVKEYYAALEVNKEDGNALLKIADFYSGSRMYYLSCDFYKRALKTDEIKADAEKRERIASAVGANYYASRADAQAVDYLGDYLKNYPQGKRRETALAMIAISYANLKKEKDAAKYFEMLKTEFPASKNISAVAKAIEDAKNKREKK